MRNLHILSTSLLVFYVFSSDSVRRLKQSGVALWNWQGKHEKNYTIIFVLFFFIVVKTMVMECKMCESGSGACVELFCFVIPRGNGVSC